MISEEYMVDGLKRLFRLGRKHKLTLTFFEYLTLLGYQYFKDMQTEVCALEVGLGGLKDPTNIIDPLLSIITTIGFDHIEELGPSLLSIA